MSTIKKQSRVERRANRKRVHQRHVANRANKQANVERTTTAGGLFVAYIKERGFVRDRDTGRYIKRCDNGDMHAIVMDYIPNKAALLIINPGSGSAGTHGELAYSVHYSDCPLPTKTVEYLERKRMIAARKPQSTKRVPQWKKALKVAADDIKDAAVIDELATLLAKATKE